MPPDPYSAHLLTALIFCAAVLVVLCALVCLILTELVRVRRTIERIEQREYDRDMVAVNEARDRLAEKAARFADIEAK